MPWHSRLFPYKRVATHSLILYTVSIYGKQVDLIKRLLLFFILLHICLCSAISVCAAETDTSLFRAEVSAAPQKRGDTFTVTVRPNRDISAFVLEVEYDSAAVTQVRAELTGTAKGDYLSFSDDDGTAALVYTAANNAMTDTGGILLHFRTDKNTESISSEVKLQLTDAADAAAQKLLSQTETHTLKVSFPQLPSSESSLQALTPPSGTLTPAFDPNIYEYTLEVPFTYTTLNFDAIPAEGATVRVNRKNLSAGGTTVDFNFTVTAADNTTKTVYTVAVTRLEKEEAPAASPSPDTEPSPSGTPSSAPTASASPSVKATASAKPTAKPKASSSKQAAAKAEDTADPAPSSAEQDVAEAENGSVSVAPVPTAGSPNIYIYPERETNLAADRLITAAIVLFSVCTGVGIAVLLQSRTAKHVLPDNEKTDKPS